MVRHHDPHQLGGEGFISSYNFGPSIIQRNQGGNSGRNLEAETDGEAPGERCCHTFRLAVHGLFILLSYTTWDHLPGGGTSHSGLGPLPHQSSIKKMPYGGLLVNLMEAFFSIKIPSSQMPCVQLTSKLASPYIYLKTVGTVTSKFLALQYPRTCCSFFGNGQPLCSLPVLPT